MGAADVAVILTDRNALVERHRGLAIGLASRFAGKGEEMDDLVQVAMMALTKAIDRFVDWRTSEPELGRRSRAWALENLSLNRSVQALENVIAQARTIAESGGCRSSAT